MLSCLQEKGEAVSWEYLLPVIARSYSDDPQNLRCRLSSWASSDPTHARRSTLNQLSVLFALLSYFSHVFDSLLTSFIKLYDASSRKMITSSIKQINCLFCNTQKNVSCKNPELEVMSSNGWGNSAKSNVLNFQWYIREKSSKFLHLRSRKQAFLVLFCLINNLKYDVESVQCEVIASSM